MGAMTFMDLDFKSLPVRQRFLTQYLLAEENEQRRQSLIEEIEDEQKANGLSEGAFDSGDGMVGTMNQTQMIAVPQITPSGDNGPMVTSMSYSFAESVGLPEDEKKDAKKRKVKSDLRKQRENLKQVTSKKDKAEKELQMMRDSLDYDKENEEME